MSVNTFLSCSGHTGLWLPGCWQHTWHFSFMDSPGQSHCCSWCFTHTDSAQTCGQPDAAINKETLWELHGRIWETVKEENLRDNKGAQQQICSPKKCRLSLPSPVKVLFSIQAFTKKKYPPSLTGLAGSCPLDIQCIILKNVELVVRCAWVRLRKMKFGSVKTLKNVEDIKFFKTVKQWKYCVRCFRRQLLKINVSRAHKLIFIFYENEWKAVDAFNEWIYHIIHINI